MIPIERSRKNTHTRNTDAAASMHFFKTVVGKNGHNVGIITLKQERITVF